jgi:hypothetical protein
MTLFVILVPALLLIVGLGLGAMFGPAYPARWWLFRTALLPFLCWLLACYIMVTPAEVPLDYDPAVHGNPGRADFVAILFFGLVVPVFYTLVALPISLGHVLFARRRAVRRQKISTIEVSTKPVD